MLRPNKMRSSDTIDTMMVARSSMSESAAIPCRASSCTLESMNAVSCMEWLRAMRSVRVDVAGMR